MDYDFDLLHCFTILTIRLLSMTNIKVMDINIDIYILQLPLLPNHILSLHIEMAINSTIAIIMTLSIIPLSQKNVNIAHRIYYVIMIKLFKHVMIFGKTVHYYNTVYQYTLVSIISNNICMCIIRYIIIINLKNYMYYWFILITGTNITLDNYLSCIKFVHVYVMHWISYLYYVQTLITYSLVATASTIYITECALLYNIVKINNYILYVPYLSIYSNLDIKLYDMDNINTNPLITTLNSHPSTEFITPWYAALIKIINVITCTLTCTPDMLIQACKLLYICVYELKDYKSNNSDSTLIKRVESIPNYFFYVDVILEFKCWLHFPGLTYQRLAMMVQYHVA